MAMRLADTFLVHRRSCFAILFSGQTSTGVCPVLFGQRSQGAVTCRIERMVSEQMFVSIAFTSCKCECSQ